MAMTWRSSLALVRQMWALVGRVLLGELSQMSLSLRKKSAAVSTMQPMLGASLPREPARLALAMAWRPSLAHVRQFLALGGQVLL